MIVCEHFNNTKFIQPINKLCSALAEAQDVFGLDFDPAEFEGGGFASSGEDGEGEGEGKGGENDDGDFLEDDSEGEERPVARKRRGKSSRSKKQRSIYDVYEPSELEQGHFTEADTEIRVTDQPERFQVQHAAYTCMYVCVWYVYV